MTTNYAHKFTKTEWQIIALAGECHLYMNFGETNNKEVEKEKCLKKQQRK
ncbi:MAG: hypothetical protein KAU62_01055 [Candidatus Heimdallarchaeota archaeon]|nr:hypothetical protein [Candidatus Heimdallarchaeota archaeon]MCK4609721.1 hypothetical protein [Candidatus Heimdallarchaeota archaeon]